MFSVKRVVDFDEREKNRKKEQKNKLYVGKIPFKVNEEKLERYFRRFGALVDVMINRDHKTKKSNGFGFVVFEEESGVFNTLNYNKPHLLDNVELKVQRCKNCKLSARFKNEEKLEKEL